MNNICRACMCQFQDTPPNESMFNLRNWANGTTNIQELLQNVVYKLPKINATDGLPQLICNSCLAKLVMCDEFQKMCIQSDEILRNNLRDSSDENIEDSPEKILGHVENEVHSIIIPLEKIKSEIIVEDVEELDWNQKENGDTIREPSSKNISERVTHPIVSFEELKQRNGGFRHKEGQDVSKPQVCSICNKETAAKSVSSQYDIDGISSEIRRLTDEVISLRDEVRHLKSHNFGEDMTSLLTPLPFSDQSPQTDVDKKMFPDDNMRAQFNRRNIGCHSNSNKRLYVKTELTASTRALQKTDNTKRKRKETTTQRKRRLAKEQQKRQEKLANETPEERFLRLEKRRERLRNEPQELREARLADQRRRQTQNRVKQGRSTVSQERLLYPSSEVALQTPAQIQYSPHFMDDGNEDPLEHKTFFDWSIPQ